MRIGEASGAVRSYSETTRPVNLGIARSHGKGCSRERWSYVSRGRAVAAIMDMRRTAPIANVRLGDGVEQAEPDDPS